MEVKTIGEIIRKAESDFISGNTQTSDHVNFSMRDTLNRIDAYLNSKHISGETDSLGREKPFFNIVTAISNVWYRATDIDRNNIYIRATKSKDWIDSFLATVYLRRWMKKNNFGLFLNTWGRVLSRYGSAVIKKVENNEGLHINVIPWSRLIVDSVDFDSNPKIEIIELTEAQLLGRIKTHGYDREQVESILESLTTRKTTGNLQKDNKNDYIKLYEIHGNLPLALITGKEKDKDEYSQQMHIISFVRMKGRKNEYQDFTLFSSTEKEDPYMITHLIEEDGRTIAIGAVEHSFDSQWMMNHSMKEMKDTLDLASKMIFQTADAQFLGRNVLSNIETGDILIHSPNAPLTQINNSDLNIQAQQSFAAQWKQVASEISGVSEAMLGETPRSGTAWRQTQAVLQESHSLFELMTENKGLYLERILREWIIPHLKKGMNNTDEITATLKDHEINKIDSIYLKNKAIKMTKRVLIEKILSDQTIQPGEQTMLMAQHTEQLQGGLQGMERFFRPDELGKKTWKEQFKDLEMELDIDITGEAFDARQNLATLQTALQMVLSPGFGQNKKAQAIVGKILELTGTMSPMEYVSLPESPQPQQPPEGGQAPQMSAQVLPNNNKLKQ